jgi:protein-tyrosine phosphatase
MKILMVCLGNICRSPLAEGVLRHKLTQLEIKHITVDSAGTSNFHIGEHPDPRTQENAALHNIDLSKLTARQFHQKDFDLFDVIYVMDAENYKNVKLLARNDNDLSKVHLLLNEIFPNENRAVPDPYFGGSEGFENVYQLVDKACDKIIQKYGSTEKR